MNEIDLKAVDARIDVEVLTRFIKTVDEDDRVEFAEFCSKLIPKSPFAEAVSGDFVKALAIVVSVALANVEDLEGEEILELIPFIQVLTKDPFFSDCLSLHILFNRS